MLVNDVEMIALDELATTFQVVVRDDTLARAVTVTARGKTIVLTPEQSIASVAGRLVSLPAAPARIGGRWHVPIEFIPRALALITETKLDLRKGSRLLIAGDLRVPRVVIHRELPGNGARLVLDIAPPTPHTRRAGAGPPGRPLRGRGRDRCDACRRLPRKDGCRRVRVGGGPAVDRDRAWPAVRQLPRGGHAVDPATSRLVIDVFGATEAAPPTDERRHAGAGADAAVDDRRACARS